MAANNNTPAASDATPVAPVAGATTAPVDPTPEAPVEAPIDPIVEAPAPTPDPVEPEVLAEPVAETHVELPVEAPVEDSAYMRLLGVFEYVLSRHNIDVSLQQEYRVMAGL